MGFPSRAAVAVVFRAVLLSREPATNLVAICPHCLCRRTSLAETVWRLETPILLRKSACVERPIMKLIRAKFLLVALLAAVATVASVASLTSANHHPANVIASDDPKGGGGG